MKKFLAAIVIGLSLVTFTLDASAARLGGRASFGRSMSIPKAAPSAPKVAPNQAARPAAAPNAAGSAAAAKSGGLGRSLLIGAASALGFMALANMLGLGEGFGQMLMILVLAALAFMAFRMFMARRTAASSAGNSRASNNIFSQPQQPQQQPESQPMQKEATNPFAGMASRPGSAMDEFADTPATSTESNFEVPAEFDKEAFLNMSTSYFKMLQSAWDSGDMDSLSNYCTNDMFIELTHQRREIKGANVTMILSLDASLAGFETTPTEYVASVLFEGNLNENGEPTDVKEIWNLVKPREGKSGWLLAGIQQAE